MSSAGGDATVIGRGLAVRGELSGGGELVVRGLVEGSVAVDALVLEAGGELRGDARVRTAVLEGTLAGNVLAAESVELRPGCRMVGDIAAPRVSLAPGASLRGRVEMGEPTEAVSLASPAAAPVAGRAAVLVAPASVEVAPPVLVPPAPAVAESASAASAVAGPRKASGPPPVPASAALLARRTVVVKKA